MGKLLEKAKAKARSAEEIEEERKAEEESRVEPDATADKVAETAPQFIAVSQDTIKPYQVGELIAGKGIFAGAWRPEFRSGDPLKDKFNFFAAPVDFRDSSGAKILLTFTEAMKLVASLKNWHGHDGSNYTRETDLLIALNNGSYNGGWFIPTFELLRGRDLNGNDVFSSSLYAIMDIGAFKDTFDPLQGNEGCYWSMTEGVQNDVWTVHLLGGSSSLGGKDRHECACRLMRAERVIIQQSMLLEGQSLG